jgi:hypothetical protein
VHCLTLEDAVYFTRYDGARDFERVVLRPQKESASNRVIGSARVDATQRLEGSLQATELIGADGNVVEP